MKLSPLKGVLIHIIYWSCVAILTVISTAIGILESILYSKGAFMYLVRVFWSFWDPLPLYSKDTSLHEVRENCKKIKLHKTVWISTVFTFQKN